ncbi:NAD(P)/FAD-dependent oxidoreductase [Desulforhopalus sp. IMCC35007]|uniref:phytoene desaturase family protein n=1 Tax=Desulforhopalus sp. IMCC35007 TaxID=2569543 RepID=UPI0010AE6076|nr:FAD-dependent oxidoreductase [Desulforhopalus sp. IMCC35007]TKB10363.1 NAD(P)/FAD-dependent oxidoreductase [Desulforhopalus sp. IMCC35007]
MPVFLKDLQESYDVIIIGSGLGGLTTANRLAYCGHKVLLLEHHHRLGGLATWFKRRGHIFDISLHGFPYGMVKTCKKYWNKEIMQSIVQLPNIVFNNPQFNLKTTFNKEDFTHLLQTRFGVEASTIKKFFDTVTSMNFYDDQSMTTRELFEEFFPCRSDIHRLLMEPITYANGSTLDDPAITYGIVFSNFMNKGVYTFSGGTDKLIGMMEKELEKNGVTICTKAKVNKILIEKGKVCGVSVDGTTIKATAVVSNSGITNTIFNLTESHHYSDEFLTKAKAVRVNNSSCQVYMGIKKGETIEDVGDLLFTSTADEFDSEELLDLHTKSKTFSIYYPKTRPGHDRYTIVASMNSRYSDWAELTKEQYLAEKESLIDRSIKDLEKYIPGVTEKIDWVEAATPKTFNTYTLHTRGTSFGTKFEGLDVSRSIHKQVGGLFHVGSVGIIMSGWLGAINYGVIVSNDVDSYLRA